MCFAALRPPLTPAPSPASPCSAPEALHLPYTQAPTPSLTSDLPQPLCARQAGFSLHAARSVETHDRAGLERLCQLC
jgi:hypothetical protein